MKRENFPSVVVPTSRSTPSVASGYQGPQAGLVLLATAPGRRNADAHYDYRWDSHFYYLTGFREPEAVLAIVLGSRSTSCSAATRWA
jgi:Xaa-Pro aminopeptidase